MNIFRLDNTDELWRKNIKELEADKTRIANAELKENNKEIKDEKDLTT